MKEKYESKESHKWHGVELNKLVWKLLEKKERTPGEDDTIIHASHASFYHWGKAGTVVNIARGYRLLSHVYAVLNKSVPALIYAKKCMEVTDKNKLKDFDLAYAYEAMSRAYAVGGNKANYEKYMKLAKNAGEEIKNDEDRKIFMATVQTTTLFG
ncbi:MAG: hypothetical protein K8T10_17785 [Candidatus Eremiobacteraeota bacterium]|nr:hypothetical protein [Candidatus Eremiobacteraeota bacterium]